MRMRAVTMVGLGLAVAACSTSPSTAGLTQAERGNGGGHVTGQSVKVPQSDNPFTLFETLQTRPLALSPSGKLLFAANTPDNRLEIFHVGGDGSLEPRSSVVVGLE